MILKIPKRKTICWEHTLFLYFFEPSVFRFSAGNNLKLVLLIMLFIYLKQPFVLALNSTKAHESVTFRLVGLFGAIHLCIYSFAERTQTHKIFSASGSAGEGSLIGECTKKTPNNPTKKGEDSLVRNFYSTGVMFYSFIRVEPVSC